MRKLEYADVKAFIESFGHTLLSDVYVAAGERLIICCCNKHTWNVSFNAFKNKHRGRCPYCNGANKHNDVVIKFKHIGNNDLKTHIVDFTKRVSSRSFYQSLKKESNVIVGNVFKRTSYLGDSVRFTERIYHIVNDLYDIQKCGKCKTGIAKFNTFDTGYRYCSQGCNSSGENNTLSQRLRNENFDTWIEKLTEKELIALSDKVYFLETGIIKIECGVCGKKYERHKAYTNTCPRCAKNGTSKGERELRANILNYVRETKPGIEVLFKNRKLIKRPGKKCLEVDILIPELKIAIEYGSHWWHGDKRNKKVNNRNRIKNDNYKKKWLSDNEWNYFIVKEEDWIKDKEKELSKIYDFIKN